MVIIDIAIPFKSAEDGESNGTIFVTFVSNLDWITSYNWVTLNVDVDGFDGTNNDSINMKAVPLESWR